MTDIKLFRVAPTGVQEIPGSSVAVEKTLQSLVENNLEAFLGVRFLASEHVTGKVHGGKIDTLGIDENNCPVIIEYKRALNENVINQGLFYLNWLMDHKAEFKLLVLESIGKEVANAIEWKGARLLCIAGDFTKYDKHAVQEIPRNIELIRYRRYGEDLVLFELIAATAAQTLPTVKVQPVPNPVKVDGEDTQPAILHQLAQCSQAVKDRYELLRAFLITLGDDVQERKLDQYIAFRRLRTVAYVQFRPTKDRIHVSVNIKPKTVTLEPGFTAPDRPGDLDHSGLVISISDDDTLERAKPLIVQSFEKS